MNETEQRDLAICRWLTGDPYYGRAVLECGTCGGDGMLGPGPVCPTCKLAGEVFREWLVCGLCYLENTVGMAANPPRKGCDKCKGEGRIPDEDGREVIAEAVQQFVRDGCYIPPGTTAPAENFSVYQWVRDNRGEGFRWIDVWNIRHNQPWQSALESHVREYQQPPPDLRANDGAELKRLLRDAGKYDFGIEFKRGTWHAYVYRHGDRVSHTTEGDTEADALYAAVVAALEGGDA